MLAMLPHPRRCAVLLVAALLLLAQVEVPEPMTSPPIGRRLGLLRGDSGEKVWFLERLRAPAQQAEALEDKLENAASPIAQQAEALEDKLENAASPTSAFSGGRSSGGVRGERARWRCPGGRLLEDPVVVVGTDGSGTRVVAKLLSLLNVEVRAPAVPVVVETVEILCVLQSFAPPPPLSLNVFFFSPA
jgi:hypothetical protein